MIIDEKQANRKLQRKFLDHIINVHFVIENYMQ